MRSKNFWKKTVYLWPVLASIRLYQLLLSPESGIFTARRQTCRFWPSCSHYSYQAFEKFGFFKGSWLSLKRILRCHPFSQGGVDSLP